jgi:hypothetical protein
VDDRSQGSAIEFLVVGYNHLGKRTISSENDVTSMLSLFDESDFQKGINTLTTGKSRK